MTERPIPTRARTSDRWFERLPQVLEEAVQEYSFLDSPEYQDLAELSGNTVLEGLEIDPESAVVSGEDWTVPGTVYVTLTYDPNSDEPVEMHDSYPIVVHFRINGEEVEIQNITVDVESFYS